MHAYGAAVDLAQFVHHARHGGVPARARGPHSVVRRWAFSSVFFQRKKWPHRCSRFGADQAPEAVALDPGHRGRVAAHLRADWSHRCGGGRRPAVKHHPGDGRAKRTGGGLPGQAQTGQPSIEGSRLGLRKWPLLSSPHAHRPNPVLTTLHTPHTHAQKRAKGTNCNKHTADYTHTGQPLPVPSLGYTTSARVRKASSLCSVYSDDLKHILTRTTHDTQRASRAERRKIHTLGRWWPVVYGRYA
jgi:hypothetical protein